MGGSSAHRRKKLRRRPKHSSNSRSGPVDVPTTARTLTFDEQTITTGPGFNLLLKSGWLPGQSLGLSLAQMPSTTGESSYSDIDATSASTPQRALFAPLPIVVRNGPGGVGSLSRSVDAVTTPILSTSNDGTNDPSPQHGLTKGRNSRHNNRGRSGLRRHGGHSHPRFDSKSNRNHDFLAASSALSDQAMSPTLVRHLASLDIFDPLRPRCQYDPDHIVRDLKALHKHEQSCPANPHRGTPHRVSVSSLHSHHLSPSVITPVLQDDDASCAIMGSPVSLSSDSDSKSDCNSDIDSVMESDSDSVSDSDFASDSDASSIPGSYDFGVMDSEFDGVDWTVLSSSRANFVSSFNDMKFKDDMDCDN